MKQVLAQLLACAAAFAEIRLEPRALPFILENGAQGDFRLVELMLGGVAALDYNNDGCLDVFFTNGAALPSLDKREPRYANRLLRGNCKLGFSDVTAAAGLAGAGYSMGAAAGDYDGDGHTDLFVAGVGVNRLYRNLGDGRFADETAGAGMDPGVRGPRPWSVAAGWFDYNSDGRPDLFVVNYVRWNVASEPRCGQAPDRFYCHPDSFAAQPNQLWRNNGDGTFTDVSVATGIAAHAGKGMSVAFADFDGDGWMDVYVPNDSMRAFLFRNEGGARFAEVGLEAGVALRDDGMAVAGMGADFRDYDNDGLPDLVVTAMINDSFLLFRNLGHRWQFEDARIRTGLLLATRPLTGWGTAWIDFDNDGWKDLFFALSHFPRMDRYTGRRAELPCQVLANREGRRFARPLEVGRAAFWRGAAFGDFDNDGLVDAVVSAIGSQAMLLHNRSVGAGNWIGFRVREPGVALQVTLPDGRQLFNHASTSIGYASSSEPVVRFGLGAAARASKVELRWPGGRTQTMEDVAAGRIHEIWR